ncbi:MAG TPA: hypothetical protein VNZ48_03835 [Xanthobacteraceae bacterium]|jgi:hypothetical protein|nr:hypothetical protein [Xanthobacteraceae bacterium]
MKIRLIGPLLCAGMLVIAMSIGAHAGPIVATGENFPDAKNTKGNPGPKGGVRSGGVYNSESGFGGSAMTKTPNKKTQQGIEGIPQLNFRF